MADTVFPFEAGTVSAIPASWEQDLNTHRVFGWLRPLNEFARHAFHLVVEQMILNPDAYRHARKFIHVDGQAPVRSASVSGPDDQGHEEETGQVQTVGAFKFSTAVYPKDPGKGWYIGTGRDKPEVDILLGPSDRKWNSNQVLGNHARIYIHKESCVVMVEALHSIEITGSMGVKHLDQKTGNSSKVLEYGHRVDVGRCAYIYECGDAIENGNFDATLPDFMKYHYSHQWKAHPILSAPSSRSYLTLDGYTFLPGAFAGGGFGEVTAGWAQNGSAIAVKRFKNPDAKKLSQHQKIMSLIGHHANILELLHSSSNLEPAFPAIYCVYSPLALATFDDAVRTYNMNLSTHVALLVDYLQGLVYLHDTKGIMHRDIKPINLGVLSFSPPKGVILDLDGATTNESSDDHMQGTVSYLAPEIIKLKLMSTSKSENYGRSVDVWALGISAIRALMGKIVDWNEFDDSLTRGRMLPKTGDTNFVLKGRLERLHEYVGKGIPKLGLYMEYNDLLRGMTTWLPSDRRSASQALEIANLLAARQGEARVVPRSGSQGKKRKIGET